MTATVAAALKKIVVMLITNPKVLKTVVGIILGIIVMIVMPIAAFFAVLSGDIEIDTDEFYEMVMERIDEDKLDRIDDMNDIMNALDDAMDEAHFSDEMIDEARLLLVVFLSDIADDGDFIDDLISCFEDDPDYEELIENVNDTFDTDIDPDEFERMMERIGG